MFASCILHEKYCIVYIQKQDSAIFKIYSTHTYIDTHADKGLRKEYEKYFVSYETLKLLKFTQHL